MRKVIYILALALPATLGFEACGPTDGAEQVNAGPAANRAAASALPAPQSPPPAPATAATAAADAAPTPTPETARRISIDEARDAFERGQAVFVDVRGEDAYRQGHIRGALSIPTGTASQHVNKLPKDKLIITYCA